MDAWQNVVGGVLFGTAARAYQLGLQKRPVLQHWRPYLLMAALFGGAGFLLTQLEREQAQRITSSKEALIQSRNQNDSRKTSA